MMTVVVVVFAVLVILICMASQAENMTNIIGPVITVPSRPSVNLCKGNIPCSGPTMNLPNITGPKCGTVRDLPCSQFLYPDMYSPLDSCSDPFNWGHTYPTGRCALGQILPDPKINKKLAME